MLATLVLMGGGAAIWLLANRLQPRLLQIILFLTPILAILSLLLSLSPWAPWAGSEISGQPLFSASGISLGFSLSLGFMLLVTLALHFIQPQVYPLQQFDLWRSLFFAGLGMAFLASQNALGLLLAWGFLDLALLWIFFQGNAPAPNLILRAAGWNLLGGIILLAFAFGGISFPILLLAFWVRMGLYPAVQSLSLLEEMPWPAGRMMQIVLILCGGYILARFPGLALTGIGQIVALALVVLTIVWGILSLWKKGGGDKLGFYVAQVQMGFLLLAYIAHPPLPAPAIHINILSIVLPWLILDAAKEVWPDTVKRWPQLLLGAVLVLGLGSWVGLPLTPGFSAKLAVYSWLWQDGLWWVIVLGSIVTLLITLPLIHLLTTMSSLRKDDLSPPHLFLMAIVGLVVLALGIYPGLSLVGNHSPTSWDILTSMSPAEPSIILLATLIPIPLGYLLYRRGIWMVKWPLLLASFFSIIDGEWFYAAMNRVWEYIGRGVRALASWGEGRGGLGWYLVFSLLLALWALSSY